MRSASVTSLMLALALGCAGSTEPSPLEPKLGHSQPLPPEPDSNDAPASPPTVVASPAEPDEPSPEPEQAAEVTVTVTPPEPATGDDEELCRHITRIVLAESGNAAGLTGDQIDELIVSCSLALAQDRRQLDPEEFRRRAECVRKAETVAGFSACGE